MISLYPPVKRIILLYLLVATDSLLLSLMNPFSLRQLTGSSIGFLPSIPPLLLHGLEIFSFSQARFTIILFLGLLFVILILLLNIKRRYRIENELQEKSRLLDQILNTMPNIVHIKDKEGRIRLANKALADFCGRPVEKLLGKKTDQLLVEPDEIEKINLHEREIRKSGSSSFSSAEKITNPVTEKTHWYQTLRVPFSYGTGEDEMILTIGSDITERKQIEQELRSERNFVNAVLKTAGALIVILDSQGRIIRFNKTCERLSGYSFEEVRGKKIWERLIPENQKQQIIELFNELTTGDLTNKTENHWITKSGVKRLISWANTVLTDEQGEVEYVVGIGIDITSHRRAEEALRRSEKKYRSIFEHTGSAMIIIEDDSVISGVNDEFAELSGYSRGEIVGRKSWTEFIHPDDLEEMKRKYRQRKTNPGSVENQYEFKFLDKDGNPKHIYLTVSTIPDSRRVIASLIDITDRKRIEEKLRKSEKQFRTIVVNAPGIIFRCLNDEEWTMKFISEKIEQLSGYPAEALIDNKEISYQQLIYPDDRQKVKEAVAGGQYDIIYRMITRSGEIKWIRENGQVVSYDNSGTDYVDGILLDITELKQTQQQLEQSLSEKDTLLKETHHRVKNNLFVVVSLLEMQAMRSHDPRVHAILQQSVDRVHAMALVHEKLYRSQSLDQIDFAPYLENLVLDLLHSYGAHDNNIKINIEADNEALVLDQAIPCGLIINELISNSLQHAFDENGGEINLEFKLDESEETKYRLLVEDNGSGFPENFDLQESDSLGLQLVSSLAQNQLNGEFEMLNTDNGAAFEIKF